MTIIRNLSNAEYHARPELSKSQLDDLDRSPAIFYARHRTPGAPKREETPAMALGTMVHTAVLEPESFWDRYRISPKIDRRTKEGKAEYELMMRDMKPGQQLIDSETAKQCDGMRIAVRQIPPIAELLSKGEAEVSAFWVDKSTGVDCRCRPDWVSPAGDGVIICDLKTTKDASPAGFAKSVVNFNYAKQAAFYSDGWEAATGQKVHGFVFAAVENAGYPWASAAYMLTEEDMDWGRRAYQRNLSTFKECNESATWPGYGDDIQLLQLPAWAKKEQE